MTVGPHKATEPNLIVVLPPPNDDFINRLSLAGSAIETTNSNFGASRELDEPAHALPSVDRSDWFTWTAPRAALFELSVGWINSTSAAPVAAVYTGDQLAALQPVPVTPGSGPGRSVVFPAAAGTTYQIAVGDQVNDPGNFRLSLAPLPIRLTSPSHLQRFTLGDTIPLAALVDVDAPVPDAVNYWITPAMQSGQTNLGGSTVGPDYALALPATQFGSYELRAELVAGATRLVSPPVTITVGPTNDAFAGRALLTGDSALVVTTNSFASSEPGETSLSPQAAGRSLWWSWTAPDDGIAVFNAYARSGVQPLLGLYTGDALSNLVAVTASNSITHNGRTIRPAIVIAPPLATNGPPATNTLFAFVTAGTTYQVQLDSRARLGTNGLPLGPDVGTTFLGLALARFPANDDFAQAPAVAGATVNVSGENSLATQEAGELEHANFPSSRSLWWKWTAPANGLLIVGIPTNRAVQPLAIYTGTTLANATRLDHNRSAGTGLPTLNFSGNRDLTIPVSAGMEYRIVGDFPDPIISPPPPPSAPLDQFPGAGHTALELNFSSLRITSPLPGTRYVLGEPVLIRAEFAPGELEGPIDRVELLAVSGRPVYLYGTPLGGLARYPFPPKTAPPYEWLWINNSITATWTIRATGYTATAQAKLAPAISVRSVPFIPTNDSFTNRLLLPAGTNSIHDNNDYAATDPGDPALPGGFGRTLWYSWTAPSNGLVILSNQPGQPVPAIGVFTGASLSTLTALTNNAFPVIYQNSNCPPSLLHRATLAFEAVAGTEYQIAVDGYSRPVSFYTGGPTLCTVASSNQTWAGEFTIDLRLYPRPLNDLFTARAPLIGPALSVTNSNRGASREPGEPVLQTTNGRSLWYSWTAPFSGSVGLSTNEPTVYQPPTVTYPPPSGGVINVISGSGSNNIITLGCPSCGPLLDLSPPPAFFPVFGVYQGTTLGSLLPVATGSDVRFDVVAGQTYQIAVDGWLGTFGEFVFHLTLTPPPPNDQFASRIALASNVVLATGYNIGASREAGEPFHAGDTSARSVWWSWTASGYGPVSLDLAGSTRPFPVGVYLGNSVGALNTVSTGRGNAGFWAHQGKAYQIAVEADQGVAGLIQLTLSSAPVYAPVNWTLVSGKWRGNFSTTNSQSAIFQRGNSLGWTNVWIGPVTNATTAFTVDGVPGLPLQYRLQVLDQPLPTPFLTRLESRFATNGNFQVGVGGIHLQRFILWSSTNLVNWTALLTNQCSNGTSVFVDPSARTNATRTYRVTPAP